MEFIKTGIFAYSRLQTEHQAISIVLRESIS